MRSMLQRLKSKCQGANFVFFLGICFVGALTLLKTIEQKKIQKFQDIKECEVTQSPLAISLDTWKFKSATHTFFLSKQAITNQQFEIFTKESNYITLKEFLNVTPNWKVEMQNNSLQSPALWLDKEDVMQFCIWLAKKQNMPLPAMKKTQPLWDSKGYRLPSVEELNLAYCFNAHAFNAAFWEWTGEDLSDHGENIASPSIYQTHWKPNNILRHLRSQDMQIQKEEPIVFRLAWTYQTKAPLL